MESRRNNIISISWQAKRQSRAVMRTTSPYSTLWWDFKNPTNQRHHFNINNISEWTGGEAGERDLSIEAISKIAKHFNMTIDQLVNFEGDMPQEVSIEDKNTVEQMQLIQQLDEEGKDTVFNKIDKMLSTKKFKDFFTKNVATL